MSDSLGRVVGILIAVCLMFFVPILYFGERQETLEQLYLLTETTDFVDTVRLTGTLDQEVYQAYCKKLEGLSGRYEIKMTHQTRRLELVQSTLQLIREEYYQEQMLEELNRTGEYFFEEGDFFRVELVKKSPQAAERMWKKLLGIAGDNHYVSVYYGGKICYDGG